MLYFFQKIFQKKPENSEKIGNFPRISEKKNFSRIKIFFSVFSPEILFFRENFQNFFKIFGEIIFCVQKKSIFLKIFLIECLYNKERTFVLPMNTKKNIFLTPREASELTGKSEITIKRLAKQLFNKATTNNDHKVLSLITKKKAPKGFFWKIEEEFLKEQFNISSSKEKEENSENKMLKEQIKIKDSQISQLLERQRETNILLKNSQDKNLLLEEKNEVSEKKGFWKKIFS